MLSQLVATTGAAVTDVLALAAAPITGLVFDAASIGLLGTALVLGFRHGLDWDHIAAITDITSTTAAGDAGEDLHEAEYARLGPGHRHGHGGTSEIRAHDHGPGTATYAPPRNQRQGPAGRFGSALLAEQRHAILLGTLYAMGHASVVAALGLLALAFGTVLPDWVDPIMGRVVGATLLLLGIWVFVSLYQYARHGREFRLRSRWMLIFDSVRYGWRRFQARLHGHEHVDPVEMSSYGAKTAFGVGMIHGVGAETGSQVLLIAAIGGASGAGLGVPMMVAFIVGLLASNTIVVVVSASGFVASQLRTRLYVAIGVIAGVFSLVVGSIFLFGLDDVLPDLPHMLGA
jgi:high-affinity nickel-transport protein